MKMLDSGDVSDHPYQTQFQAFFDALDRAGHAADQLRATSLRSFEVIFAADKSAEEDGRAVKLSETEVADALRPRHRRASGRHRVRRGRHAAAAQGARLGDSLPESLQRQLRHRADGRGGTARTRLAEAQEAARILGATFHAPICDDLELAYDIGLLRKVTAVVREAKADIVLTHSPQDYMEDHMNASRLAVTAAFSARHPELPQRSAARGLHRTT